VIAVPAALAVRLAGVVSIEPVAGPEGQSSRVPRHLTARRLGRTRGACSIAPGGAADASGLEVGDCIVSAQSRPLRGAAELRTLVFLKAPGALWTLEVLRGGARTELKLTLSEAGEGRNEVVQQAAP
jgi:S1-C subfamily serine protease